MVWLGQLFVSPLVSSCFPTCCLTCLLGWMLSQDGLARSDAVTRWSGLVSPLSPHLFAFVSQLVSSRACRAGCCHKMVWLGQLFVSSLVSLCFHLFPHALAGLDAVTRWSVLVSSLSPHLFAFVSALVFSLACWAAGVLDAVTRWSGSVSP